jgi:site-specific DNA recombinase
VRNGWTIADAHVFVDDGISGAEFAKHAGFLRLMNSLKPRPPFQVLVMSEEYRLGREAIETAYALKRLVTAGVRVFFYLEDRERTLDSPTDKVMLSLTAFADELEREKARQRTFDAMQRKAKAGHVTGGACFGYRNIVVNGLAGTRSHVERRINDAEATVIQQVFRLCAEGNGMKAIAKRLNSDGALSPRAQRGRSQTWAPSSVRDVLFRDVYRGVIAWNRTRKRDQWGAHHQTARPSSDWIDVPAPHLRIVPDELWQAAHARLKAARALYLAGTKGHVFGRPPLGNPSKYLLTNLALCGCCDAPLKVISRDHGNGRKRFYGCASYHDRGRTVCSNRTYAPMEDADRIVIEALIDDVLDRTMIAEAIDEALGLIQGEGHSEISASRIAKELQRLEHERERLIAAIAAGRTVTGLLEALQALEDRKTKLLEAERAAISPQRRVQPIEAARVRRELTALAGSWRQVLTDDPENARPIVKSLLVGRVTISPTDIPKVWELRGQGTPAGLFSRFFPLGMASPPGYGAFTVAGRYRLAP